MYTIINKNNDGDQQAITVQNKMTGQMLTYYECEFDGVEDVKLREFLKESV